MTSLLCQQSSLQLAYTRARYKILTLPEDEVLRGDSWTCPIGGNRGAARDSEVEAKPDVPSETAFVRTRGRSGGRKSFDRSGKVFSAQYEEVSDWRDPR